MQENVAKLYPNPETSAKVLDCKWLAFADTLVQFYVRDTHENPDSISKSTQLPDWLLKYHEWGCNNTEVPRYLISTFEAQALVFLARLVGAKRGMSFRTVLCPAPNCALPVG